VGRQAAGRRRPTAVAAAYLDAQPLDLAAPPPGGTPFPFGPDVFEQPPWVDERTVGSPGQCV